MTLTLNTTFSKVSAALVLAVCSWAAVSAITTPTPVSINGHIQDGAKPVLVDDKTGTVWSIEDPQTVKGHDGHHITATGTTDAEKKEIHITKVEML